MRRECIRQARNKSELNGSPGEKQPWRPLTSVAGEGIWGPLCLLLPAKVRRELQMACCNPLDLGRRVGADIEGGERK